MMRPLKNKLKWHSWFAWYPVDTVDGMFVWFQTVQRRQVDVGYAQDDMLGHSNTYWEYQS